jgi:hypothetical protein
VTEPPDPLDDSGSLVSKDRWQRCGIDLVTQMASVWHTGGHHSYEYFIRAEIVQLQLFNREGVPVAPGPPLRLPA